jgi:ATP-binding cassette subfamily F protein uup
VFEGDGRVEEYVGGYNDWLRQRQQVASAATSSPAVPTLRSASPPARKKLSFKEQRELDELPQRIEKLEAEQAALQVRIASPDFYKEPADVITRALARVDELKELLHDAYARWDSLDARSS